VTHPDRADGWVIRPTLAPDSYLLPAIEVSAAAAFLADPELAWLATQEPLPRSRHLELLDRGICLVIADKQDRPQGFIATERFGAALHIWEISVSRERQGFGLGRRLLDGLEHAARNQAITELTLTTFRDLAWNAPFYRRCGFDELGAAEADERLAGLLAADARHGLPTARRCAMIKRLSASA
jgi:GNAT superfamily N-acetyltransferase